MSAPVELGNQQAPNWDDLDVPPVSPVFRGIAWAALICLPFWAWVVIVWVWWF